MDSAALDWFADTTLLTLAEQGTPPPDALRMLLRRYAATGRPDLAAALEMALGQALHAVNDLVGVDAHLHAERVDEVVAWLRLIVEAASLSEDGRLRETATRVASALWGRWPSDGPLARDMRSIEGCLVAASVVVPPVDRASLVSASIDELERLVGLGYKPGHCLPHVVGDSSQTRGTATDHTTTASALLAAYAITGRLQYSMLAEELIETARQVWWDRDAGLFSLGEDGATAPGRALERLVINCDAARVLWRLAALHADAEYREYAAFNRNVDHAGDARSILDGLASTYRSYGLASVGYGLAVEESLGQL